MTERLALALRAVMLRTGRGRLRPAWSAAYAVLARAVAAYLRRGGATAVWLRGSGLSADHVHGLSDVDLVCVAGAGERARVERRVERLRAAGPVRAQVDVSVYEPEELAAARGATVLTYGLTSGAGLRADPSAPGDPAGLLLRPYGARRWRLVSGRAPGSASVVLPLEQERLAGWLELQSWWRHAFALCARPDRPDAALLALKLHAEPTRVLLRALGHDAAGTREDVLRAAAERLPEEEAALREAPRGDVDAALGYLLRTTGRVARLYERDAEEHGSDAVELLGAGGSAALPLADWRALTGPELPDEAFVAERGDPARRADILAAAGRQVDGHFPVLTAEGVAVLPTLRPWPAGVTRAVHFPASAPALFAQLEGQAVARFPRLPGWSAGDTARRAVAEHRAWLAGQRIGGSRTVVALGLVLKAARAALLLATLEEGAPRLALTPAPIAELAGVVAGAGVAAPLAAAAEAFARCRHAGFEPPRDTVVRADAAVRTLPAYADVPQAQRLWPPLPAR